MVTSKRELNATRCKWQEQWRLTLNSDDDTETEKVASVAGAGSWDGVLQQVGQATVWWVAMGFGYVCVRVAGAYKKFRYVR